MSPASRSPSTAATCCRSSRAAAEAPAPGDGAGAIVRFSPPRGGGPRNPARRGAPLPDGPARRHPVGMSTALAPPPSRSPNGLQVGAIVAGCSLALIALVLLLAGGGLRWVDGHKDSDGYLTTHTERFRTQTFALPPDDLDVDSHDAGWLVDSERYGKVRLRAASRDGRPVFVGIAPTAAVRRYLGDSAYARVTDIDADPFKATYRTHGGSARPAPPASQGFWVASAHRGGRARPPPRGGPGFRGGRGPRARPPVADLGRPPRQLVRGGHERGRLARR